MAIIRESNVTFTKWPEFRQAINQLVQNGTYKNLVDIHANMSMFPDGLRYGVHRMHGAMAGVVGYRRFLPWHRAYLIAFERELRNIDNTLSIPYWDWDADGGRLIGISGILGLSSQRDIGLLAGQPVTGPNQKPWFSNSATVQMMEQYTGDYYPWSRELEGPLHGGGHNWVGGDMSNAMISPNDPIFWCHHAQIDRIWSAWQINNPNEKAFLSGADSLLDPWDAEYNNDNIQDISALGQDSYSYGPTQAVFNPNP